MNKTATLRKLVFSKLQTVPGDTYHRTAPKDAAFPYKTFELSSVAFVEARDDLELEIDLWDLGPDPKRIEELADQIERLFANATLPTPPIYPTFFRENRYNVEDPDKNMKHIQLRFLVQLYETEE